MKRIVVFLCAAFTLFVCPRWAVAEEPRTLDIYFLDMVGGASTSIVTPPGEAGNPGTYRRDPTFAEDGGPRSVGVHPPSFAFLWFFGGLAIGDVLPRIDIP